MTSFHLGEYALLTLRSGVWFGSGMLIGAFHLLTLHWNVRLLAGGGPPLLAFSLQLGRFALVAGMLGAVASYVGALPLLTASAGIFTARMAAVRLGGRI